MQRDVSSLARGFAQGSPRFILGDRALSGGDIVEVCCSGGWLAGRFEWDDAGAYFHFSIELGAGEVAAQRIALPEGALMRLHAG
jgi:hypothetical protein